MPQRLCRSNTLGRPAAEAARAFRRDQCEAARTRVVAITEGVLERLPAVAGSRHVVELRLATKAARGMSATGRYDLTISVGLTADIGRRCEKVRCRCCLVFAIPTTAQPGREQDSGHRPELTPSELRLAGLPPIDLPIARKKSSHGFRDLARDGPRLLSHTKPRPIFPRRNSCMPPKQLPEECHVLVAHIPAYLLDRAALALELPSRAIDPQSMQVR